MADQRKRLSKDASKILFEIICEDSFEGQKIKCVLPATRRISKTREGLWDFIRTELKNRSGEDYDLGTLSAAWYYNLRKIGSCLDQIDLAGENGIVIERMRTMERYLCKNLGDRYRRVGSPIDPAELEEARIPLTQMLSLSRQSTMDSRLVRNSVAAEVNRGVTLDNSIMVKNERGSSNEEREKERTIMEDNDDEEEMEENEMDQTARPIEIPTEETRNGNGGKEMQPQRVPSLPSRYNTAESTLMSRNNSTNSVSGYDADNEKGLIKRRRKELKTRGERRVEVKVEEEEKEVEEEERVDEVEQRENEEMEGIEEREVEECNEKTKMMKNLNGMIDNLRDHILSLGVVGVIDRSDMTSLAGSFESASKSISNSSDTA
ncbi:hypothetical protein PFISCL1PPCAC_10528 [Pristionchus fissidentatus]|uniref:SPK domain-containing protein n=1 Tax=Pristionchus fissidentatus TaxID=1538716 RepID=A0AAV5VHY1_9BILA|nr:hypothetical protein PFISCL1PPCAC_10528 [Pristionchus fissidentatus]